MTRLTSACRESYAAARSRKVLSAATIAVIAGMTLAVLLTTGRTLGSVESALATIDSQGSQRIVVRSRSSDSDLRLEMLSRLKQFEDVRAVVGLGPAVDVRNSRLPQGPRAPLRHIYGDASLTASDGEPLADSIVYAYPSAGRVLGFRDGVGGVTTAHGQAFAVRAAVGQPPAYLAEFEPLLIAPTAPGKAAPGETSELAVLVITMRSAASVEPIVDLLPGLLGIDDPTAVSIESSRELTEVRSTLESDLGRDNRILVLTIAGIATLLVSGNMYAAVTMRRRDYARRRALGARRSLLCGLLLTETGLLGAIGAGIGAGAALTALSLTGDPLPPWSFIAATQILAIAAAVLAGLLPTIAAVRRDPARELRVP